MSELLSNHEAAIRITTFLGLLIVLIWSETRFPRRKLSQARIPRWRTNIGMVVLSSIMLRFLFPAAAIGVAHAVEQHHWGLLNYYNLPYWLQVVLAFVLLDLSVYFQHVIFHTLPLCWRFHRVHHTDIDCDVTTGVRFHPGEIILSMLIKFITISALGTPMLSVVVFEIALNATSMFTHANIRIPERLDHVLRWLIVTPDMHRVHHSTEENETNSNFGFNISLWDRIFGTYLDNSSAGQENMNLGLWEFREPKWASLRWLLYMPFTTTVRSYAINQRAQKRRRQETTA